MLLTYIILQGDKGGSLFSCRVDSKKSSVLYSVAKERIPNAIVSLCFKKHVRLWTRDHTMRSCLVFSSFCHLLWSERRKSTNFMTILILIALTVVWII